MTANDMEKNDEEFLKKTWERYHNAGIPDLPNEAYFDFGVFFGMVWRLKAEIRRLKGE